MKEQFDVAVNQWLCTDSCECFEGPNGETKDLWESYGEEYLNSFGRTTESGIIDCKGKSCRPLKWTADRNLAINSFSECYESSFKNLWPRFGEDKL